MNLDRDQKRSAIYQSIYNNPERIFKGYEFKPEGNGKAARRHDTRDEGFRITFARDGAVVLHNNGDHSTLLIAAHENAVKVWQRLNNLPSFDYAFRDLADIYGIDYSFDEKTERCFINAKVHKKLLPTIWPIFVNELTSNPTGDVAAYLDNRMLRHDGNFASRYGALTPQSIAKAKAAARSATDENGKTLTPQQIEDAFKDLHLDDYHCTTLGYKLIIALNQNGKFDSITLRPIDANFKGNKYLQPTDRNKFAAYEAIDTTSKTAYLIEGYLDKATLEQIEYKNVFAYGGQGFNENLLAMLQNYGFTKIIYIPDIEAKKSATNKQRAEAQAQGLTLDFVEYNPDTGEPYKRREIIDGCINTMVKYNNAAADRNEQRLDFKIFDLQHYLNRKFGEVLAAKVKDINDLYIYENREDTPENPKDLPLDKHTIETEAKDIAEWELIECDTNATASKPAHEIIDEVLKICDHTRPSDWRNVLKTIDTKDLENLKAKGITPELIADERTFKERRQTEAKKDKLLADITHARKQGDTDKEAQLLRQYNKLLSAGGVNNTLEQARQSWGDTLANMGEGIVKLRTKWVLGKEGKNNNFIPTERISFKKKNIAVICAPSSHAKTCFLFTTLHDFLKVQDGKNYIYISCEESKDGLAERLIRIFLSEDEQGGNIPTIDDICIDKDGKKKVDKYGRTIRWGEGDDTTLCDKAAIIRGKRQDIIEAVRSKQGISNVYRDIDENGIGHNPLYTPRAFAELKRKINAFVENDLQRIFDGRLNFAHSDDTATNICETIKTLVEDVRRAGGEVGAVFVDYFQLLREDGNQPRNYELKDICVALLQCAEQTDTAIITAAQLNRDTIKATKTESGFDNFSLSNIGEAADIERIASDVLVMFLTDRLALQAYSKGSDADGDGKLTLDAGKVKAATRARRVFEIVKTDDNERPTNGFAIKTDKHKHPFIYIENLKARHGSAGCWGLLSVDFERGYIDKVDTEACNIKLTE